MRMLRAWLMATALLLGGTAVASAADICFEVDTGSGTETDVVNTPTAFLVGRAFGSLPGAGACKQFRGFIPGVETAWATGQACGSSSNADVSFFMPVYNSSFSRFGSLFFPLKRSTLTGLGMLCAADTGVSGSCQPVTVTKVPCPAGVTVPEGTLPRCPGIC
jgi:hypothetical protein